MMANFKMLSAMSSAPTSLHSWFVAPPSVAFAVTDAIYAPLFTRQVVNARQCEVQANRNDSLLTVSESYFNVQQARGEYAGSLDAVKCTEDLTKRVEGLAEGLSPAVEKDRAQTELSRRRQAAEAAYERWQLASAELSRLLRLDPSAVIEPIEAPHLRVDLIDPRQSVDDLIPLALTNRPELASDQAIVNATLARLKQERIRPLVPSVLIRGGATNPAGTLAGGYFGGGINGDMSNFNWRNTVDVQLLWELQNLGFGNRALVRQREAENQQAILTLFRTQDQIAAEVVKAHAQSVRAVERARLAESGLQSALQTVEKNLEGLRQTRNIGGTIVLVFRPQEVVAAIQSLDQAYRDYFGAIADANQCTVPLIPSSRPACRIPRIAGTQAMTCHCARCSLSDPTIPCQHRLFLHASHRESKISITHATFRVSLGHRDEPDRLCPAPARSPSWWRWSRSSRGGVAGPEPDEGGHLPRPQPAGHLRLPALRRHGPAADGRAASPTTTSTTSSTSPASTTSSRRTSRAWP